MHVVYVSVQSSGDIRCVAVPSSSYSNPQTRSCLSVRYPFVRPSGEDAVAGLGSPSFSPFSRRFLCCDVRLSFVVARGGGEGMVSSKVVALVYSNEQ